jgi:hypothetical protein
MSRGGGKRPNNPIIGVALSCVIGALLWAIVLMIYLAF